MPRALTLALGFAASVGVASCAKQGPPAGGPVDKTAPALAESHPASGDRNVPVGTSVRLQFSEKLDRRSLERGLAVNPRVRWAKMSWSGPEVTLIPVDSLLADTTYVVTLGSPVQDRRSNAVGIPIAVGFSTGPEIDQNVLVGRVVRGGQGAANAGVWLFVWKEEGPRDPEVDVPYRQSETDREGNFVLPFLRPGERVYELFAYLDANRTGAFEEGDPWGFFPEPLTIAPRPDTTGGIEVSLWDSERTGCVMGRILGSWEDEGRLRVEMTAPGDSTAARWESIGALGPFRVCGVSPGKYFLSIYQDVNGNGVWDSTETLQEPRVALPDTLEVAAGEALRDVGVERVVGEAP